MHALKARCFRGKTAGFTLVEIAIALLILTILAGSAIAAFRVQISYTKTAEVREQIREAREALANYAIANGVLPCPATDDNGVAVAACGTVKGFLPWRDLGLSSKDPWGHNLRYGVSAGLTSTGFGFNTVGSLKMYSGPTNIDPKGAVAFSVWSSGEDSINASEVSDGVVTETPGSDDAVEWVSRYLLFGKMMSAGKTVPLLATASSSSSAASSASSAP